MSTLPDFKLEVYLSRWEFAARYHMTASDAESMTLSELLILAEPSDREAFETLWLGYTETYGAPDLRDLIASTYDGLNSHQILCFAGAEEGLYAAMHVLLAQDDHAIILTPNYQSAETLPAELCATTGIPLDPDDNWSLDLDRLTAAIRPNTKLISINFPHNPTGKILEREKFDDLIEICRSKGIWLFSDEVYRGIEREPSLRLPNVADVYERGLSLNVLSKTYGLPGLRIGWVACQDKTLLARMERFKHYLSICNAGPSERLAMIALKARERILARNRALVLQNLRLVDDFFRTFSDRFEWVLPDGGMVGYPRYNEPEGVEAFTKRLVEEAGIVLLPASVYQSALAPASTEHFRIGFGRSYTKEGLDVMREHLMR